MADNSWKDRVEERLARSGLTLASLTPATGLDFMLDLLRDHPEVGDLSFTWGRVTQFGPDEDGFTLRCWCLFAEPYSPSFDLSFKVGPADTTGRLPEWNADCGDTFPGRSLDIATFRMQVEESPAFRRWGRARANAVTLFVDENADSRLLFDRWGVRNPDRPVLSMTAEEWFESDDVGRMLRWFRQEWRGEEANLDRLLRRYCLACARRIWPLLPLARSRLAVEIAERYLDGLATREEFGRADHAAEDAAFAFDYHNPEDDCPTTREVTAAIEAVARMPEAELTALLQRPRPEDDLSPRGMLIHAAYFVWHSLDYPGNHPERFEQYCLFLSAPLLREVVGPHLPPWGATNFGR